MTAQTRRLLLPHSRGTHSSSRLSSRPRSWLSCCSRGGFLRPWRWPPTTGCRHRSAPAASPQRRSRPTDSLSTDAEACDARADQATLAAQRSCPLPPGSETGPTASRSSTGCAIARHGAASSISSAARPPGNPSSARRSRSRQLAAISGKATSAWVLSSKCQSFEEDRRLVTALPKQRGVVVINVGLSRFLTAHKPSTVSRTSMRTQPPGGWYQHHYDLRFPLSLAVQRGLVRDWVRDRSRLFAPRYPAKLADLERVVEACLSRGMHPVLLDMPLNVVAVGHAFDDARAMYREGCRALAEEQGIPYLRFGSSIGLHVNDFFDLWHLLPSGAQWLELSRLLVSKQLPRATPRLRPRRTAGRLAACPHEPGPSCCRRSSSGAAATPKTNDAAVGAHEPRDPLRANEPPAAELRRHPGRARHRLRPRVDVLRYAPARPRRRRSSAGSRAPIRGSRCSRGSGRPAHSAPSAAATPAARPACPRGRRTPATTCRNRPTTQRRAPRRLWGTTPWALSSLPAPWGNGLPCGASPPAAPWTIRGWRPSCAPPSRRATMRSASSR